MCNIFNHFFFYGFYTIVALFERIYRFNCCALLFLVLVCDLMLSCKCQIKRCDKVVVVQPIQVLFELLLFIQPFSKLEKEIHRQQYFVEDLILFRCSLVSAGVCSVFFFFFFYLRIKNVVCACQCVLMFQVFCNCFCLS